MSAPIRAILALAVAILAPAAGGADKPAGSEGLDSAKLDPIYKMVERRIEKHETPGAVWLVAQQGRIVRFEAQGLADPESGRPMSNDTLFRISSLTKPLTATAVALLCDEGLLNWDDPVSKYLPEFDSQPVIAPDWLVSVLGWERRQQWVKRLPLADIFPTEPARHQTTIFELLALQAGLPNGRDFPTHLAFREIDPENHRGADLETTVAKIAGIPAAFHPGSRWRYGCEYDVAGRLIEKVTGQRFSDFMRQRVLLPLGMVDTYFHPPSDKVGRIAATFRGEDAHFLRTPRYWAHDWLEWPETYDSGSWGLSSTVTDYYRFTRMLLAQGDLDGARILRPETMKRMTTNHAPLPLSWPSLTGCGYGLGFSVVLDPQQTQFRASKGTIGWIGHLGTYFFVDPEKELIGIFMTQALPVPKQVFEEFHTLTMELTE